MKVLQLLFLGPLSILCLKSTAQVEDLMRNKNITWIAESYNDFLTDSLIPKAEKTMEKYVNDVKLLKFRSTIKGVSQYFALQNYVLKAVKEGKLSIYEDADCSKTITYDLLCKRDTVYRQNLTTKKFESLVKVNEIRAENLPIFRARQILYYDSINTQFGLRTLAIAPMYKLFNETDEPIGWRPAFWIKADDLQGERNVSDTSITWANQIEFDTNINLEKDSIKFLKQLNQSTPKYPLFEAFHVNDKISFYKPHGTELMIKFSLTERKEFFEGMDTIETIDPTTYQTKTRIVYRCFPTFEYDYLGLLQNWYWDDTKKRLEIWHSATSILKEVTDSTGNVLYKQPLFYRRTDD